MVILPPTHRIGVERGGKIRARLVTTQVARVQGFGVQERSSCRGLIAAGPNRPCGRMARTKAPPRIDCLNPEPRYLRCYPACNSNVTENIWPGACASELTGSGRHGGMK